MAVRGLPRYGARLQSDNPLLEGVVRSGVVELAPDFIVECGCTFVWWTVGKDRELARVVGAGQEGPLPARCVLAIGGVHEVVAFLSELELWAPPKRHPNAAQNLKHYGRHRRIY